MNNRLLIIIVFIFIISVLLYVFVMTASGHCDLLLPLCTNFGGGSIDPDLSPSFTIDFAGGLFYLTILPLAGLFAGISALFLVPYFILKRKNIATKPYMALILSVLLLHYGITGLITYVPHLPAISFVIDKEGDSYLTAQILIPFCIQVTALCVAGILLYRSSVIRDLIKK